jgi:ribonuclease E
MKKEMLINVLQPEECRIAIVEDGILEELYVERTSQESYVGNIYKGRIVNIEPSIQAAFVDFGIGRNGFLHVSDVEPAYYRHLEQGRGDNGRRGDSGRRGHSRDRGRGPRRRRPEAEPAEEHFEEPDAAAEEKSPEAQPPVQPAVATEAEPADDKKPSKGRSRGRGRSRRSPRGEAHERSSKASEAVTASDPEVAAGSEAPAPAEARESDTPPEGPSLFMPSAERRTEADEEPRPSTPPAPILDEDLFFPRPAAAASAPAGPRTTSPSTEEPASDVAPAWEPPLRTEQPEPSDQDLFPGPDGSGYEVTDDTDASEDVVGAPSEIAGGSVVEGEASRAPQESDADLDVDPLADLDDEELGFRPRRSRRDDRRGRKPGRSMGGRPGTGRPKPLIQDIFRRGQEVLVQVIKEGIGTKGPTLSTYISIAGRYLVLMPGLNRVGVSRKIADDEQRRRLREIFHELQPPKGLGFIIRTAGIDKTKKELQRDLAYLSRLWQVVVGRIKKCKAPARIYEESDMITRTIRDTFTSDIDTIWVDEAAAFEHAQEFLQIVMPRYASRIKNYADSEPLFHKYGIEDEIVRIQQRHVPLPHGGSIVIDQTEALVAIDVNSGNFRADNNAEETAFQMNLQAAKEIARQLRLRDLGGVIVNDFIDMREEKHRREVERAMRDAVKRDRARTKILKMSQFGLIEMTRQRIRPSLKRSVYQDCPHCHSTGQVKTCESMSIDVMRMIQLAAHREGIHRIQVRVHEDVANYLLNRKRKEISRLEETGDLQVTITGTIGIAPEALEFVCYDNNNNEVKFLHYEDANHRQRRR